MAKKTPKPDPKAEALRRHSCFNPHPEKVSDPPYGDSNFFDARDLVQVKYEMLRRVRAQGQSITDSAAAFGLSRPSFYEALSAFEQDGLAGLLRKKPGPRRSHKLSEPVVAFVEQLLTEDASLGAPGLSQRVFEQFGLKVHPRSVERALARQKKKKRR